MRFCSRCGLPLGVISNVINNDGQLPPEYSANTDLAKRSKISRSFVLKFAFLWVVTFWMFFLPIAGVLESPYTGIFAVLGFGGGLVFTLIGLMFFPKQPRHALTENMRKFPPSLDIHLPKSSEFSANQANNVLSPRNEFDLNEVSKGDWRGAITNDLVIPPSVTENTTKLLRDDDQK